MVGRPSVASPDNSADDGPGDLLVVGLGNPGEKYASTRHNVGAWVARELVARNSGNLKPSKHESALVDDFRIGGDRLTVAFPTTFMNESGRSVTQLVRRRSINDLSRLLVVHDELDLPVGRMKFKFGGGLAGNNGLKSIKSHLHTSDFARLRIGIGKPTSSRMTGADYVLRSPSRSDRKLLDEVVVNAVEAIEYMMSDGIESAMNQYNSL